MASSLILVGGGAKSGKSRFALSLAAKLGARRLFIATAQAKDAEMAARIAAHQQARGDDFATLEVPIALAESLRTVKDVDVVVIDCLTLWLANLLLQDKTAEQLGGMVRELIDTLEEREFHTVIVTNEVGMGIVPENALARQFRDIAGSAHQRLSERADEVYFALLGTMLRLKPRPALMPWE